MTTYADLKTAQKAADIREHALKMTEEYLDAQVRNCEYQLRKWEAQLEAYQDARSALEAKRDLAARTAT